MKKSLIGSLIGVAIVVAADTIIRVIISLIFNIDVTLFLYEIYGIPWSLLICSLTLITSFLGGAFAVTNADSKKKLALIMFGIWLMAIRYGQIHFVMEQELLLPIVSLVFSLLSVVLVWRFFLGGKKASATEQVEPSAAPGANDKKHHSPNPNINQQ